MRNCAAVALGLLILMGISGCAWTPRKMVYPSGRVIIRTDQRTLDTLCSRVRDNGQPVGPLDHATGCYAGGIKTIYLLNNCEGAESLPHELAHEEGIEDPEKAGFNW